MNKPKYIEARYSAFLTWDLEELGIDWDKVEDYSISRGNLEIEYKEWVKETFKLDHDIELEDEEITEIEFEEIT